MVKRSNEIPKRIPPAQKAGYQQRIPRIIFQTFKTRFVGAGMFRAAMTWVEKNSEYEYRFYDDEDCRDLIRENFDSKVVEAFDDLEAGASKANLWRYCALYVNGGVYADIDTVCCEPLRELIGRDEEFIAPAVALLKRGIFNAFICSVPEHPFLKRSIERSVTNVLSGQRRWQPVMTGVLNMGAAINLALEREERAGFGVGRHVVNGFSFRILKKIHTISPDRRRVMDGRRTILMCKYPGYYEELVQMGEPHWSTRYRPKHYLGRMRRALNSVFRPQTPSSSNRGQPNRSGSASAGPPTPLH